EHDQPRHDEGAVADPVDFRNARADGGAENDEIKRGRDHRRHHALQERAQGTRHLHLVDRPYRVTVHQSFLTRETKISSSELAWVSRSRKPMPAASRSRSSEATPGRSAW